MYLDVLNSFGWWNSQRAKDCTPEINTSEIIAAFQRQFPMDFRRCFPTELQLSVVFPKGLPLSPSWNFLCRAPSGFRASDTAPPRLLLRKPHLAILLDASSSGPYLEGTKGTLGKGTVQKIWMRYASIWFNPCCVQPAHAQGAG